MPGRDDIAGNDSPALNKYMRSDLDFPRGATFNSALQRCLQLTHDRSLYIHFEGKTCIKLPHNTILKLLHVMYLSFSHIYLLHPYEISVMALNNVATTPTGILMATIPVFTN